MPFARPPSIALPATDDVPAWRPPVEPNRKRVAVVAFVFVCFTLTWFFAGGSVSVVEPPATSSPDVIVPRESGPLQTEEAGTGATQQPTAKVLIDTFDLPRGQPPVLEISEETGVDGAVYNASGEGFVSSVSWQGQCWHRITNFCVVKGDLVLYHSPKESTAVRGGSFRMCNEFSRHSPLIRLKYRSEPSPAGPPAPLLTKTQGWILQFWCQDMFHMTLGLLPAFNTKRFLGEHPDVYVRIAKGKRAKSAFCRIKFGSPLNYSHVYNSRWGGDHQFPFPGNPYWPFYESISPDPWRIHPLYSGRGGSTKSACYTKGAIDKLYVKDMNGQQASNYTTSLREIMRVPPSTPRTCGKYRVTFIDRRGKTRRLTNVPEIVAMINAREGFEAQAVPLESLPIREQLRLMTNTDVLMGMHGNGLTWLQFLQPGAVVVELIGVWYQPYSKLWGLLHLHSSMKNNMQFKLQGEFKPFEHNTTEIMALLDKAKEHLDVTSCGDGPSRVGPSPQKLEQLYRDCAPHC
jgi:hypothetical protein